MRKYHQARVAASIEITTAAVPASRGDRPRPTIAPKTIKTDDNNTISCPAPNRGGSTRLPTVPPMALAWPPPAADVVNHGSQALTARPAALSTTNHPGRRRAILRP